MEEGAVVVAQLVEQSLSTPEVRSSNPFIGNIFIERFTVTFLPNNVYCKDEHKEKRPRKARFKKWNRLDLICWISVTRLGDLLDFGQLFKAFNIN